MSSVAEVVTELDKWNSTGRSVSVPEVFGRHKGAESAFPGSPASPSPFGGAVAHAKTSPAPGRAPSSARMMRRSVATNVLGFLRGTAQVLAFQPSKTVFPCVVCHENCDARDRAALADCPAGQRHAACSECLGHYLRHRIEERRIKDLRCPLFGADGCEARAQKKDLQRYLEPEVLAKYHRFLEMSEDPELRECPVCQELVKPHHVGGAQSQNSGPVDVEVGLPQPHHAAVEPQMACSQGHLFCFYHSNAHQPGPGQCEAYARSQVKAQRAAMVACQAKECPGCGIATDKTSGCNHMTCPSCQGDWCWTCGQQLNGKASIGWHYNPANPSGCMQFLDMENTEMRSRLTTLVRLLALPGSLLGLLAFWGTLPLWVGLCVGVMATAVAFALVNTLWLPVGIMLGVLIRPCGGTARHREMLVMAPWASCWASAECLFGSMDAD